MSARRRRVWKILGITGAVIFTILVAVGWYLFGQEFPEEPDLPGSVEAATIAVDGLERDYIVYAPPELPDGAPLVLVLHGAYSNAAEMRKYTAFDFDRLAGREKFAVVYPNAIDMVWVGCRRMPDEGEGPRDDLAFLTALVDRLVQTHRVDPQRVFAFGFSNGGDMALRMALETPERLRALAVVGFALPTREYLRCDEKKQPLSFMLATGSEDPIVPQAGGGVMLFGKHRGDVHSAVETCDYFRDLAGAAKTAAVVELPDSRLDDESRVVRTTWSNDAGLEIVHYDMQGAGHTLAHPDNRFARIVGATNRDLSLPAEAWALFSRAP